MKLFSIYQKGEKIEVISDTINYAAFIFGVLWLFYKKLWKEGVLISVFLILFSYLASSAIILINIVISFFIAINSSYLEEKILKKNKYNFVIAIAEKNKIEALKTTYKLIY